MFVNENPDRKFLKKHQKNPKTLVNPKNFCFRHAVGTCKIDLKSLNTHKAPYIAP